MLWALSTEDWEGKFKDKYVRAYLKPIGDEKVEEIYEGRVVRFELSAQAALTECRKSPVPVVSIILESGQSLGIERLKYVETI